MAMIRAKVTDREALAARTPAELSRYLRTHGWRLQGRNDTFARWVRPAGHEDEAEIEDEFEIIVPLDPASRDYAARIGDALATLAVAEDRSELDILRAVTNVSADRPHLPVIREAAAELRAHTPEEAVVVTGSVVRLHRESGDAGEISLIGRVDDQEALRRVPATGRGRRTLW